MQEIRCPKCNEVFQVDDSGYSQIVQQVRDKEFEKEAARRAEELEKAKNSELKILEMEYEKKLESALSEKSDDITDKEKRITELEARLESMESEKQLPLQMLSVSVKKDSTRKAARHRRLSATRRAL